jgi:hypothetical protein
LYQLSKYCSFYFLPITDQTQKRTLTFQADDGKIEPNKAESTTTDPK